MDPSEYVRADHFDDGDSELNRRQSFRLNCKFVSKWRAKGDHLVTVDVVPYGQDYLASVDLFGS